MDYQKHNGHERLSVDNVAELSAVSTIMNAFSRYVRSERRFKPDTVRHVVNAADVVSRAQLKAAIVEEESRSVAKDPRTFSHPYVTTIRTAVAMFEQKPELLTPFMNEVQIMESQAFFPHVKPEQPTA